MRSVTKLLAHRALGRCAFPAEQTTLSVCSKNNIKNTPSPYFSQIYGCCKSCEGSTFWFEFFYDPLSHKIYLIRSPSRRVGRSRRGLVPLAC